MSTTNLNTNNSSQTLFRFTTMRNPELSDPKNKERRFIFRDEKSRNNSAVDSKINSSMSLQKLFQDPGNISGFSVFTEEDLKSTYASFYDYAVWVARNKAMATKDEFDEKIKACKTANGLLVVDYKLWDNLVYQVVTQKEFYAKELIMQLLHLAHILSVYDFTEEVYEDLIKAKVVLPKELFKAQSLGGTSAGSSATSKNVIYDEKSVKLAEASMQLNQNQNLSAALKKLQENYKKQYDDAYKKSYADYQAKVLPLQKQFQKENAVANNKKQILENRINYLTQLSVADPEKFYANSELDMELHRIKDEILNIPSSGVEIPEFSFSFDPEINASAIERALGEENKNTLNSIFGTSSVSAALSGISSFDEINALISQNSQALQQTVLNNTVLNQQVSANVGGIIVPVSNTINNSGWINYSVKTIARSATEWGIMLTVGNSQNIISGNYKATLSNGTEVSSTDIFQSMQGVNILFNLNPRLLVSQTNSNGFMLSGDVVLSDGQAYDMSVTLIKDPYEVDRLTKTAVFKGSGAFILKKPVEGGTDTPTEPTTPTTPSTPATPSDVFIPSGFGMKNIGVADYKKVEQSTYCYVEGEVAHIENIMAREYKERSTRRLKRSESQTTKSSESEKEKLTDTTSTERHEMQSEVAKVLQESKDFAANAGFNASWGGGKLGAPSFGLSASASYATHNSKEESNRQAVTEAKDITARALDRIVTKVKEERIDKILEEYEENNKHGFDNTKGNSHVVGVYRWVDKVVKNQIYNYGKRMMFEFMIPEPAKIHRLGMQVTNSTENKLVKPVDPREANVMKLENFSSLENSTALKYWISKFNVEIEIPEEYLVLSKSYSDTNVGDNEHFNKTESVIIPDGYIATHGLANGHFKFDNDYKQQHSYGVGIGKHIHCVASFNGDGLFSNINFPLDSVGKSINVTYHSENYHAMTVGFNIYCKLSTEAKNTWLQKAFNKIIEAYETELAKYEQALAEARALGVQIKGSNPGFYRKIENTILRRNCISYMLNQNPNATLTFGKKRYYTNDNSGTESFANTDILVNKELDQYAAFIKFMEQAFEWEIMSYNLYPYYWGERKSWPDLYQFDDNDPIFRAFMQSGMARVIVTVRPGFEEAVRHFMATGQIWNGGEVPVIDDPLFLSLVDEMRSAKATKEGEPWREKIPTSLTILQADSIGLKVEKALPCNCEPGVKFDDNLGEMCASNFMLNENQIGQSGDQWIEISFNEMDSLTYNKISQVVFPRKYKCMDNVIVVERDASWESQDSITKAYKYLADEISQIEAVEAYSTGENGLMFRINVSKLKNFTFTKPGGNDDYDSLKLSIDLTNSTLKILSPIYGASSSLHKILDKDGQVIPQAEYMDKIPLSKFLV